MRGRRRFLRNRTKPFKMNDGVKKVRIREQKRGPGGVREEKNGTSFPARGWALRSEKLIMGKK